MATIAIALANLGHDASAMIPRSVELEILGEAARTGTGGSFDILCRYLDEQMSKMIVGQTMTADNGSSQSQATVHNDVRIDYRRFDALALQMGALKNLARAWTIMNYGDARLTPRTRIAVDPPEDMDAWTKATLPWVTAGLAVSASQIRDRLDLSEPEDEEDTLKVEPPPAPGEDPNAPAGKKPPAKGKAAQRATPITDEITGYNRLIAPHVAELEELAAATGDYDKFLEELALKPSSPLITRLVLEAMAARQAAGE
jgi:phage gp29-like protein